MNIKDLKLRIIESSYKAVEELIKIAEEKVINDSGIDHFKDDLSADRLKNAAATKKVAIFDAFEILERIQMEKEGIETEEEGAKRTDTKKGFAEKYANKK